MKKDKIIAYSIVLFIFIIYTLPYIILKQNSIIPTWDNLDSYFIWYKVISKYGWFLPLDLKIPEFLGGLPRNVFHSEFIVQVAIFNFLTPLKAYITLDLTSRLVGFVGMYLLLKDYLFKEDKNEYFYCGIALTFAFIPNLLTMTFLTILGQPLWLWTFLNIRKGNYKAYNWIILTIMPCCVNFELITPFFLTFVFLIWLYDLITKRKFNKIFLFSIFYCAFISLITIYRLIYIKLFDKTFIPHRKDWIIYEIQGHALKRFWPSVFGGINMHILHTGEACAKTVNIYILLPTAILTTIMGIVKRAKELKPILILWTIMIIISLIYGFMFYYVPVIRLIDKIDALREFQISRFYFMMPTFWTIMFAYCISLIKNNSKIFGKIFAPILVIIQICLTILQIPYFYYSLDYMRNGYSITQYTYKEYFAEEQFEEIKKYINRPQNEYKVMISALPYNIAAYNGFTIGNGYFNIFDLRYKRKLNVMNEKLIKSNRYFEVLLKYWGHQQAILPNENYFKVSVMKELGAEYILSGSPIEQKTNSEIKLLHKFVNINTKYIIYLYKIL